MKFLSTALLAIVGLLVTTACEYPVSHPKDDYNKVIGELKKAEEAQLAAAGDPDLAAGEKSYKTFCVTCHGEDGKAASAGAVAMNPRPRNLTDVKWQDSRKDEEIVKVIALGGTALGLSATMPAWSGALNETQITQVVKYVRSLKGK